MKVEDIRDRRSPQEQHDCEVGVLRTGFLVGFIVGIVIGYGWAVLF